MVPRNNHVSLGVLEKSWLQGGFVLFCLFFREKGHLIKGVGETVKEVGAVVSIQAALKGIIVERVRVLSPQCELDELAVKPA